MNTTLVVVRSFGAHAKGDVVSDAAAMAQILAGENAHNVVRVLTPATTPAPAPSPAPTPVPAPAPTATKGA